MLVVFGNENADKLRDRMTVLELDTFMQNGLVKPITAYAVLEMEDIPLQELTTLDKTVELHNTMLTEYRNRRFNYCEQALEHLTGKWSGKLDSFYLEFSQRISKLQEADLPEDWNGIIHSMHNAPLNAY